MIFEKIERVDAVRILRRGGISIAGICETLGISERTVRRDCKALAMVAKRTVELNTKADLHQDLTRLEDGLNEVDRSLAAEGSQRDRAGMLKALASLLRTKHGILHSLGIRTIQTPDVVDEISLARARLMSDSELRLEDQKLTRMLCERIGGSIVVGGPDQKALKSATEGPDPGDSQ